MIREMDPICSGKRSNREQEEFMIQKRKGNIFLAAVIIIASMAILASGCGRKTVVPLEQAGTMTEEQLQEELTGFCADELHGAWGEPVWELFGADGEIFLLNEETTALINYDGDDRMVQSVKLGGNSRSFEGIIKEVNGSGAVVEAEGDVSEFGREGPSLFENGSLVSVTLDDGTKEAQAGDRVRVIYSGGVMESYPLQLGNQISIELLEESGETEAETNGSREKTIMKKPPVLYLQDALSSTYSKFEVSSGGYTWYCRTENEGEMAGIAACGAGPLDEAKEKKRLELPRYNKLDYVSYMVTWEEMPDHMTVKEYSITDLGNADAEALSITSYDEIFAVDLKPGRVYEIAAEWAEEKLEEKGFYGNASYVVVTE